MEVTVTVKDIEKAIGKIKNYQLLKKQKVKDIINTSALNIQKGAKKRAPVDFGRLRSSIAIEPWLGGMVMTIGTSVFYAPYVEYGTGKYAKDGTGRKTPWRFKKLKGGWVWTAGQKPKPFLFPAYEEEWPKFVSALKGELRRLS